MLNKEKYANEILEIACNGDSLALNKNTGKLCSCNRLSCSNCMFRTGSYITCCFNCKDWCNSEYEEPKIDWSKVSVDTPIYVKLSNSRWMPRYFAKSTENEIYYFSGGRTSFTKVDEDDISFVAFANVKLARKEDIEKYSK